MIIPLSLHRGPWRMARIYGCVLVEFGLDGIA